EPHPPKWTGYQLLALIFGTLLSSQGTDASFVPTLAGFPPGFVLRFQLYQTHSVPFNRIGIRIRWPLGALPFGVFTTLAAFPCGS
ncbi:hypothetical protein ABT084_28230, partial [Streptomyces sp. NPDC002138]|uniref:hypothetical protein n=1 Tax=Streptomyces sp. NPDC002138 TaxID=3154410 RepID=UPI003327FE44